MTNSQLTILVVLVLALIAGFYFVYLYPQKFEDSFETLATTTSEVSETPVATTSETLTVKLHLRDQQQIQTSDCSATRVVERTIPKTPRVADAALRLLFQEELTELLPVFQGVTISGGVARLDFRPEALTYLNSAACMQQTFKAPIEKTLKEFPTVQRVEYSINGKLFEEWDA